ncbi:MAG: hypothetical protein HDKAJFGB_03088 [Anaerolineae bacterium]|nr:hypothetical protein [Anaerolineae bacterium]
MHIRRRFAGQQGVQRRAERVNVAARVGVAHFARILFERRIFRRADAAQQRERAGLTWVKQFHESEIYQHDAVVGRENHVVRFNVAVNNFVGVQINQRLQNLSRPIQDHRFGLRAALLHEPIQVFALNQIHDDIFVGVNGKIIVNVRQIGMIDVCQHLGFAAKLRARLRHALRGAIRVGRAFFERDVAFERKVARMIDRAHAALAQQVNDFIALVDDFVRNQSHGVSLSHCIIANDDYADIVRAAGGICQLHELGARRRRINLIRQNALYLRVAHQFPQAIAAQEKLVARF